MERLLSSSPPASSFSLFPSRVLRKPCYPLPSRLGRVDSPKLAPPPTESRRVGSVSCSHESAPSGHPPSVDKPPPLWARGVDSPPGLVSTSRFPGKNAVGDSRQLKAISPGTFVLLSALIVALIHPLFASPAFATFQNAVKTGGPSAATTVGRSLLCTELLSSAWTGFFAGCLHTLSGPDHLAALAPLSIGRTKMESAAVGALWGCGHDAGQVIFGLLFLMLKDQLHIEVIRTWGTRVVGLTLLVIGAMGIREASEVPTPCVALQNGECNVGTYETMVIPALIGGQKKKKKIGFATFATGIVHGLQPDALMMVLPALALPSRLAGAAFLIMFLVGTVVAMGSYTVFIGSCSEALKDRVPRITEKLTWASSLLAIGLGFAILISQLFGYSLY